MPTQRAVHRMMSIAQEKLQHLGFVYRIDRVTRTGRVLDSQFVLIDSITWC